MMEKFNNFFFRKKKEKKERREEKEVEITFDEKSAKISFKDLNLSVENPTSSKINVTFERQPHPLEKGKSYGFNAVFIDKEDTEKMKRMIAQAQELLKIPENKRPRKVLEILKANLQYAYKETIDQLSKTDPELAEWVKKNTGPGSSVNNLPLSEIIEKGYGICRHLSVAYLWLAQKAGLEGVLMSCGKNTIKNIIRSDNRERLFKSVKEGELLSVPHMWVEIKTSKGEWIAVDPSTELVGDRKEDKKMFEEANYIGMGDAWLESRGEPRKYIDLMESFPLFRPGENTAKVEYRLDLKSTKPKEILEPGKKEPVKIPPTNEPYNGPAEIEINTLEPSGTMRLKIIDVKKE